MLRYGLVLLLASSALAASFYNDYADNRIVPNNGGVSHLTEYIASLFNQANININIVGLYQVSRDVASLNDRSSQALSLSQTIGLAEALGYGIQGDICGVASWIDAYAASGNYRQAIKNVVDTFSRKLEILVSLARNPQSLRFKRGPLTGCKGDGRVYQFERAWTRILENTNPSNFRLVNEEYCVAKKLYAALDIRSNNAAAVYTAISLPPVQRIIREAQPSIENLVTVLARNGNANQALREAQRALAKAAQNC